MNTWNNQHPS
ncbi:hypothetical protein VCCP103710_2875, partial [Vibrio cholerae CP1037(10)]